MSQKVLRNIAHMVNLARKLWQVLHLNLKKAWNLLCSSLRQRQPSLHSRITTVFLIFFIVFILVAGSSLLLVFNYQLHRYTEFVGDQYAVQLAHMLEAYYNTKQSWRGIEKWLYKNFTSEDPLLAHVHIAERAVENGAKLSRLDSPLEERSSTPKLHLQARTYLDKQSQSLSRQPRHDNDSLSLQFRTTTPDVFVTEKLTRQLNDTSKEYNTNDGMKVAAKALRDSPSLKALPPQQGASQSFQFPTGLALHPMLFDQDTRWDAPRESFDIYHTKSEKFDTSGAELFFFRNNNSLKGMHNRGMPNFQLCFQAKSLGAKDLIISGKLLGQKYSDSVLLSFCLTDPFCSLDGNLSWQPPLPNKASLLSNQKSQPVFDQWFHTFFHRNSHTTYGSDNEPNSLEGEALERFLREKGFPSWIHSQDRPDLFATRNLDSDNLLERLQLGYMNTPSRNDQMFVLLDPNSQVITSNPPENVLIQRLGSVWGRLQKYIAEYQSAGRQTGASGIIDSTGNGQNSDCSDTQADSMEGSNHSNALFNFNTRPTLIENRNIFVIKGKNNKPVGFLYAESIVSPIWKTLNYEVNAVILKVTMFSSLFIALTYWLIGHFHLRRLFMPLKCLSNIAKEVSEGNTNARLEHIPKEAELALVTQQFNKMLDSLAHEVMLREQQCRDVAHELRTPITIISGELQLIQAGVYQADEAKIQGLGNQVLQMQRIVQDLETLYKVSQTDTRSQREMACFESVAVWQLLNEAFLAFQTQMEQKNIVFSLKLDFPKPASEIYIQGDPQRLHQVFANCLVNAIRYTSEFGQIELSGQHLSAALGGRAKAYYQLHGLNMQQDYVLFSVSDTGCGISKEKRELVFERFFRIDNDRNQETGGSGLGLAISKSFIELHAGKIWVDQSDLPQTSESSTGAKFCFALPCSSNVMEEPNGGEEQIEIL